MSAGRGSNGFGPSPLPATEMKAWSDLKDIVLLPWEVDVLRQMDTAYLVAASKQKD